MNIGKLAEDEAKKTLEKLYDVVKETKHNEFYDFLVKLNDIETLIEVKYITMIHRSGHINIPFKRMIQFIKHGDFLIYYMSNKGNKFITPEEIYETGHVHYNELNPSELRILIRIKKTDDGLKVIEPEACRFCIGRIKDVIKL